MSSWERSRFCQAAQSACSLRQARLTVSLPIAPPNSVASARRTRRGARARRPGGGTPRRTLTGQRATLAPPRDLVQVWGNPVVAREPSGNEIKGNHLEWHRDSDTVVVEGGADNPSETLYHPAKPLPTRRPAGQATRRHESGGRP